MIKLNVLDTKKFMALLLKDEAFDFFLLNEFSATTLISYNIYGKINKDFLDTEPSEDFVTWLSIKPLAFDLIKGKKLPKQMKIILSSPKNIISQAAPLASSLSLTIIFKDNEITLFTGSSFKTFDLNNLNNTWDEWIANFFEKLNIGIEIAKD